MAIKKGLYRGYSSFEYQNNKTFTLTDIELVKMDLLNHIFTKQGERLMMPTFGTIIPEMVFEPLTPDMIALVEDELYRVVQYDPRVDLLNMEVRAAPDQHAVEVSIQLFYVELNLVDNLDLNINFNG